MSDTQKLQHSACLLFYSAKSNLLHWNKHQIRNANQWPLHFTSKEQPKWTPISLETLKKEGKRPLKTETLKSGSKVWTKRFFGRRSGDGLPMGCYSEKRHLTGTKLQRCFPMNRTTIGHRAASSMGHLFFGDGPRRQMRNSFNSEGSPQTQSQIMTWENFA